MWVWPYLSARFLNLNVNSNPLINGCKIQPVFIVNFESFRHCRTDNLWTCVHEKMGSHVFISQLVSRGICIHPSINLYKCPGIYIHINTRKAPFFSCCLSLSSAFNLGCGLFPLGSIQLFLSQDLDIVCRPLGVGQHSR